MVPLQKSPLRQDEQRHHDATLEDNFPSKSIIRYFPTETIIPSSSTGVEGRIFSLARNLAAEYSSPITFPRYLLLRRSEHLIIHSTNDSRSAAMDIAFATPPFHFHASARRLQYSASFLDRVAPSSPR